MFRMRVVGVHVPPAIKAANLLCYCLLFDVACHEFPVVPKGSEHDVTTMEDASLAEVEASKL